MTVQARVTVPPLSFDVDTTAAVVAVNQSSHSHPLSRSPTTPPHMPPLVPPPPLGSPLSVGRRRLDAFEIICLIGAGGYGKVFLVRHKATLAIYAMKVMDKSLLIERKAVSDAHAERNILAMLGQRDAPFIVRLNVAFQTSRRVYLVMDFAAGGELMFHLRREAMLSEEDARFYAAELLIALETLHDMNIVHRDIKPENVLLDGEGHLVLTDFGLAKQVSGLGTESHSWCGSEDYMAPEIISRAEHAGKPADYWAYGVFIYDCICGQPPFSPLHEKGKLPRKRLHERILKKKVNFPAYMSRNCRTLLQALLAKNPSARLREPRKIRAHAWFAGLDWDALRERRVAPPFVPPDSSPTACFSPSITTGNCSAPHSPLSLSSSPPARGSGIGSGAGGLVGHAVAASDPIAVAQRARPATADAMWQGFSFVAPEMEVHFELAPPMDRPVLQLPPMAVPELLAVSPDAAAGSAFAAAAAAASPPVGSPPATVEWTEALESELAEFSDDAKEAVEISEKQPSVE